MFMILAFHLSCFAGAPEEIASLLLFVEQSECTFMRNGKHYDAPEARRHIEKKYNYFKDRIHTAEEFIQYSATKSTMSGKPYRVECNGVGITSSDWLYAELDKLRKKNLEEDYETPDNNPDD
ncbi:MAG: hypothetical protein AMJ61_07480 [Desulfobacterales bacterium SG8_35_2]|nr:MAG: hypothetical protein AMJ61_07480 [Desulfobacterales bacterium SG8_35_2]